jgi:hypothetical protein
MEWLRWYINFVDIILSFLPHLRSSKSKFEWKSYGQNTNRCVADSTPYGPYRNPYDPYAPNPKIRTELAAAGWLIFLLYKTLLDFFLHHPRCPGRRLKCEKEVLKFERDLALRGSKFEDLHAESKPSSKCLNLIFSSSFFGATCSFIALNSYYLLLNMRG